MSEQPPRCGDHVHHEPSGEDWVVAHVSNDMLAWCGWPGGMTKLSECRVIKRCSDEEHLKLVNEIANMSDGDFRGEHARRYLRNRSLSN
jgi:hypothetical protein